MPLRTKLQIAITLFLTTVATVLAANRGSERWVPFWLLLLAVLLSSGFKVALPRGDDGTMSLNFPFILLGVVQLSPLQAMLLAAISVAAQCRVRVDKLFTVIQIGFNVANAMLSTACATLVFALLKNDAFTTAPALALSSVAYFLCNTIALASVLGSSKGESAFQLWRKEFPWYLPFYLVGAVLVSTVHWMSRRFGWGTALLLIPVVYTLYRAYMGQVTRIQERQQHLEETEALQLRTIEGLAMAIEAKDQNTHDHLFRVRHYVKALGQELSLTPLEMQALETAAFLHDIGKLAVPESIINKPGKLTPDEFEKMKIHPVVGADILERVRFPYPVVPIVRSHHEWWNGTGYPDGLQGEAIPIGARILTVVDCFDALVSDRPYRKGLSNTKALEIIRDLRGKQFDPVVVLAFEKCHALAEAQLATLTPAEFTPLNTIIDVSRGASPGAGYEAESSLTSATATGNLPPAEQQPYASSASRSAEEEKGINLQVAESRSYSLGLRELAISLIPRLHEHIPFQACALYLRESDTLHNVLSYGQRFQCFRNDTIQLGEGISGWVAENGKPIFNGNAAVEPGCPLLPDASPAFHSALAVPLVNTEAEIFAVLALYADQIDAFKRDHLRKLLDTKAEISSDLQTLLEQPNSPATLSIAEDGVVRVISTEDFYLELENAIFQAVRFRQQCCIALLHLEGIGHADPTSAGLVELLQTFACCLSQQHLCSERVAGIGQDLVVVLRPTPIISARNHWLESVQLAMNQAVRECGLTVLQVTVGSAICPDDGCSIEDLFTVVSRKALDAKAAPRTDNASQSPALVYNG